MSGKHTDLGKWLEGVLEAKPQPKKAELLVDVYEQAVAKGTEAQDARGKPEAIGWLAVWAAKLSPAEIQTLQMRWNDEQAGLQQDIERLLGGDMTKWTAAERKHAEKVGRRLAAVNLVLEAARGKKGDGQRATTTFLPKKEDNEAAATVAA